MRIDEPLQQAACGYQPERLTFHLAQRTEIPVKVLVRCWIQQSLHLE